MNFSAQKLFKSCKTIQKSNFTLWTKRTDLIKSIRKRKKPKNFQLIVSSRKLNVPEDISEIKHVVDKVFTVYTKDEVLGVVGAG